MAHALCLESANVVQELRSLLQSIDPVRFRRELEAAARSRLLRLRSEVTRLLETYKGSATDRQLSRLYDGLQTLGRQLEEMAPRAGAPAERMRVEWRRLQRRLQPVYGTMAARLERFSISVPKLRSTNYGRSLFHTGSALFTVLLVQHILGSDPRLMMAVAVPLALWCWASEAARRRFKWVTVAYMKLLGPIAHPHEHHKVNSATWYVTALAGLSLTVGPLAGCIGVAVLGLADPVAGLVGRRYGSIKLRAGRSLQGSLAFVGAGTLAAAAVAMVYSDGLRLSTAAAVGLVASTSGAVAEIFSTRLDDNLTIPVAAGWAAALALYAL